MLSTVQRIIIAVLCCGLVCSEVCSPDDNVYYHPMFKSCENCDKCLVGMGKDTVNGKDKVKWDSEHGALTCTPCIPCNSGYFNDMRGFNCRPCNVCSQQNRYELKQCTEFSDAVCGDSIPTIKPRNIQPVNSTEENTFETRTLLIFVIATVVVFGTCIVVLLLLYALWRHLRRREGKAVVNNLNNVEQQFPLMDHNKISNISSASNLPERNISPRDRERGGNVSGNRTPCRAQTTPKSVACENTNETTPSNPGIKTQSNSAVPSTSKINYTNVKPSNGPFKLCCAAILEPCLDDVSKSSICSECSALALDSIKKDNNFKSQETLFASCKDTCVLNRSDSGLRTTSYTTSTCTDSPSYFCKCYECSLCAGDVRS